MPFVGIGVGIGRQRFRGGFVGLLDEYSGAAVAYSLRQLSSTYTGNAIRVRRASDNTELNIGFVSNELDTATLESFCSGTDGFVTTWYDQSGNGRDRTQSTAANQPQIVSGGSVILDEGKPAFLGDSNDTLNTNSFIVSQPTTKFVVAKSNQNVGNRSVSASLDNNARNQITYEINNGGEYIIFAGTKLTSSAKNMFNVKALIYGLFNGNSSQIGVNNAIAVTGNAGTFNNDGIIIGTSTFCFQGYIQEEIFYASNQSSNRNGIETNINDFYSIY